jgi:hypothetical protein
LTSYGRRQVLAKSRLLAEDMASIYASEQSGWMPLPTNWFSAETPSVKPMIIR